MALASTLHPRLAEVTQRILDRCHSTRAAYLERIAAATQHTSTRSARGCANQAHGFAACGAHDKQLLRIGDVPNLAIVTSYNDMLSAHQPYERFPKLIREAARAAGGVAQVAGGVPAMCDGITQGETGMELSLFSRDVIALSTAVALSHQTFDAARYTQEPFLASDGSLTWRESPENTGEYKILRPVADPFAHHGGLGVLHGNLGRAIVKTSALAEENHAIEGEIRIFHSQESMQAAFKADELTRDIIVVVRFQGPRANGMPELHNLLPPLQSVQNHGFKVALITDGRLSGASGDVLSAIHLTPEAADCGPIARLRDGDRLRLDAYTGELTVLVPEAEFAARPPATKDSAAQQFGVGRELFSVFRHTVGTADQGASIFSGNHL
jgi:dihydroxyacid dehydratase/phosphogluconate dehydratase